jgi:hypothetical protein
MRGLVTGKVKQSKLGIRPSPIIPIANLLGRTNKIDDTVEKSHARIANAYEEYRQNEIKSYKKRADILLEKKIQDMADTDAIKSTRKVFLTGNNLTLERKVQSVVDKEGKLTAARPPPRFGTPGQILAKKFVSQLIPSKEGESDSQRDLAVDVTHESSGIKIANVVVESKTLQHNFEIAPLEVIKHNDRVSVLNEYGRVAVRQVIKG